MLTSTELTIQNYEKIVFDIFFTTQWRRPETDKNNLIKK